MDAPDVLASLDSVPPEFARWYGVNDIGLYELTPRAKAQLAAIRGERDAMARRHADETASLTAKVEGLARDVDAARISEAVREAMTRQGATGSLAVGAAKWFAEEH